MKQTTPKPIAPRPATPPLPGDLVQQLNAGLRSRNADRKRASMEACLAARAFVAGFCRGADPERLLETRDRLASRALARGLPHRAARGRPRNATSAISCSRPARRRTTARL